MNFKPEEIAIACAPIVGEMMANFPESYELMLSDDFQELMVKHGLAEKTTFDSKIHKDTEGCCEEGDLWYQYSEIGLAVRDSYYRSID